MFASLPWPLAVALVLSYVGMTIVVTAAVNLGRWRTQSTRRALTAGIAAGAVSVVLRTAYFSLA